MCASLKCTPMKHDVFRSALLNAGQSSCLLPGTCLHGTCLRLRSRCRPGRITSVPERLEPELHQLALCHDKPPSEPICAARWFLSGAVVEWCCLRPGRRLQGVRHARQPAGHEDGRAVGRHLGRHARLGGRSPRQKAGAALHTGIWEIYPAQPLQPLAPAPPSITARGRHGARSNCSTPPQACSTSSCCICTFARTLLCISCLQHMSSGYMCKGRIRSRRPPRSWR